MLKAHQKLKRRGPRVEPWGTHNITIINLTLSLFPSTDEVRVSSVRAPQGGRSGNVPQRSPSDSGDDEHGALLSSDYSRSPKELSKDTPWPILLFMNFFYVTWAQINCIMHDVWASQRCFIYSWRDVNGGRGCFSLQRREQSDGGLWFCSIVDKWNAFFFAYVQV